MKKGRVFIKWEIKKKMFLLEDSRRRIIEFSMKIIRNRIVQKLTQWRIAVQEGMFNSTDHVSRLFSPNAVISAPLNKTNIQTDRAISFWQAPSPQENPDCSKGASSPRELSHFRELHPLPLPDPKQDYLTSSVCSNWGIPPLKILFLELCPQAICLVFLLNVITTGTTELRIAVVSIPASYFGDHGLVSLTQTGYLDKSLSCSVSPEKCFYDKSQFVMNFVFHVLSIHT